MASSKPSPSVTRAVSPKPPGRNPDAEEYTKASIGHNGLGNLVEDGISTTRGRNRDTRNNFGLQPPNWNDSAHISPSPSPTRFTPTSTAKMSVQTIVPLAVNIEPPQSPPKMNTLNFAHASTYLSTESPISATSGRSSPGQFRLPSRPHTPTVEVGRSPSLSSRPARPPSPPPPRRSVEIRRDLSRKPTPPPINRADKPKIAAKPVVLSLEPGTRGPAGGSSPFSTPPGSDGSPEYELPAPALPPNRPRMTSNGVFNTAIAQRDFEPPPVHHSVMAKRQNSDTHGLDKGNITPQIIGDQRSAPALPSRPHVPQPPAEVLKLRVSMQNSMLPPPPRASMDRTRPTMATIDTGVSMSTPPKRIVSTPTTQIQTPPRTHGRSMTVDRTSDRTPTEFRVPPVQPSRADGRISFEAIPSSSAAYIKETLSQAISEYPDSTHSNRRPPYFKQGTRELPTKYDTRIFDVCGEMVCTSGHLTRVWSLHSGDNIMSLVHGEGIKIVSVSFKPASNTTDEGARLWLGNNMGELYEVDIATQSIIVTKSNAHTRREIIRIYRHKNEMWTLDDGGTLHLWAPDNTGAPNLSNPYTSFRVPKGHTFSMVVGDELWHATGKEIRIFLPSVDGNVQFQVLQRPIAQSSAGDVTSGTIISTQPQLVYFGHVDGKVSVYSRKDYTCIGIFNISVYKITSLVGVGGKLWAGFSTGMIYVYDTTITPWVVKKDWCAHQDPLMNMIADPSSFWALDRAQVVSLGQDNMLRIWDGLLQDDWIGKILNLVMLECT